MAMFEIDKKGMFMPTENSTCWGCHISDLRVVKIYENNKFCTQLCEDCLKQVLVMFKES